MGPHQGALETVGTASATPTPERVDAVRRRVFFLLAPSRHAALASVFFLPLPFPPSPSAALGLSLSRVRTWFFVCPLPSSLPSSRQTGAPTSLALPSLGLPLSRSAPPLSLALPPFPRTVAHRASLSLSVVSRPRRAPHPYHPHAPGRRRSSPAGDRRRGVPRAHNPSTKRAIRNN